MNAHTEELLRNPDLINIAKGYGLIVFCWGDDNNNKNNIELLKRQGVNAVIYDGIKEIIGKRENKFKAESKQKTTII